MKITKLITSVNKTVLYGKSNKYIVIHYTGNKTDKASSNANYFKNINRGASAHYFVDSSDVYQVVDDKDAAWAVGRNYGRNNLFGVVTNKNSISIEMCSTNGKIADKTFKNTVELTKQLMSKYKIPADHVYRHYDVCSKQCPGWKGWIPNDESIWKKFKEAIGSKAKQSADISFKVKPKEDMAIRKSPSTKGELVGAFAEKGKIFTIVETTAKNDWGKLKSGAGWIKITSKYVERV